MITATFDNNTFDAYIVNYQIGEAKIKTYSVNIPYSDGKLDLSDYYGVVRYQNRDIDINMRILNSTLLATYHEIENALSGNAMKIVFSDDPSWYWYGRIQVGGGARNESHAYDFAVTVDADPYQYQDITLTKTFTATGYIDCANAKMIVSPTITNTAAATFKLGSTSVTLSAGTHTVTDFEFTEGNNRLYVTPSSDSTTITIEYTKGRL